MTVLTGVVHTCNSACTAIDKLHLQAILQVLNHTGLPAVSMCTHAQAIPSSDGRVWAKA